MDPAHRLPDLGAVGEQRAQRRIPTGQPRVHTSADQFVSKYATGFAACDPNQVVNWLITADWRADGDIAL